MMCGTDMFWGLLLSMVLLVGFAYIIWTIANKEVGAVKITGQIIALVIVVLAVVILLYGAVYGGRGRGMMGGEMGKHMMMKPGMQEQMNK